MIKINLLPEEKKKTKGRGSHGVLTRIALFTLVAVCVMGAATFFLKSHVDQKKAEVETNRALLASLDKQLEEVKRFEQLNKELDKRKSLIESLKRDQALPMKIINDLGVQLPSGIWLNTLTFKDNTMNVEGYAFSPAEIVSYMENLKKSERISDVNLTETKQAEVEKVAVYKFKFNFRAKT